MERGTDHDIVIVGGGLAGLSAAIEASASGLGVTLLEARSEVGGRARTDQRSGFGFNEGPHALYRGGPAWRFLNDLGLDLSGGDPEVSRAIGLDGDTVGLLPSGAVSLLRTRLLRGDRPRAARLFGRLGRLDPTRYDGMTVADASARLLGTGRASRLFEAIVRLSTYANDREHASAGAALAQVRRAADSGVVYLDDGWQVLVDQLRAEAHRRGVRIRTGARAESLEETRAGVTVSLADGRIASLAVVVATGGPRQLRDLVAGPTAPLDEWVTTARAATVAVLDVGLGGPWGPYSPVALGIDRPVYLSVHGPVARLAPPGKSLVSMMRYHHPDERPDADHDRVELEELLSRVRPGWEKQAEDVRFRRRLVATHWIPRADGGGFAGRPDVTVPNRHRVHVCGDWVGPEGHLTDAVVASARRAGVAASRSVASALAA